LFAKSIAHVLVLTLSIALSASFAHSEPYSANIVGVVKDDRGGGLAGVNVSLSKASSQQIVAETTTDNGGRFQFLGLLADFFTLDFALSGWQSTRLENVEVHAHTTRETEVSLSRRNVPPHEPSQHVREGEVSWSELFGKTALHRLPSTRTVWSILESQGQSTVTDVIDIGGLELGRPALTGAHGASWTEVEYFFDGLNVTDPYIPGRPLLYPVFDDISTFEVTTASKPASLSSSGVTLDIEAPQASERFHGAARLFYSNHNLQSDNIDQRLRDFHFPGPERLQHLVDSEVQVAGKLPFRETPWPVFASFSAQNLEKSLGGFPAPINSHVYSGLAKLSPFVRDPNQVDVLLAAQNVFNSRENADPKIEPAATTRGKGNLYQIQTRWRRTISTSSVLVLGFGVAHAITSSGLQPEAESISALNLPEMARSGSAELSTSGTRTRWGLNAVFEMVQPGGYVGRHFLDLGFDWDRSRIVNSWNALGGIEQILVEGVGAEVIRWNTPVQARSHVQNVSLFMQDTWGVLKRLQLPVGLRLETSSGKADGADNDINWTTLEPRAGLVARPIGENVVLRASWSRYGHLIQGRYLDFGNVNAIGGEAFQWVDSNGDQQSQPPELVRQTRVFGGPHSAVDKGLSRPFTDEISIAVEHRLGRVLETHARFFRRDTHRIIRLDNRGLPPSSYEPINIIDPGNDGIIGTADDKLLTLFNEEAELGKDFLVLINGPDGRGSYKGFEIGMNIVTSRGEFWASFAAMKTHAPTNVGNSVFENDMGVVGSLGTGPNTFLLANSRTFFDRAYIGKMSGYYDGPLGLRVGAVAKYYDGLPFGRLLFVDSLNQGPLFVRATPRAQPGGFRTEFNMTLDLRIARQFSVQRGSLEVYLDFFNLLNLNQNTVEASLTSPSFEMRMPLAIQAPRVARLGVQWRF